ncbi:Alpha/Beta hydrolase protein [Lactifluus volemus]|nr:Alpha/Beta hydrolase protein [Lactifluus volemus]
MVRIPALLALSSASLAIASASLVDRDHVHFSIFDHEPTETTMFIVTNSGICETTPGVKQVSGYLSVGRNMHMWFWFFEAREKPSTAPLALWLNGGPGCSSMIGLFVENGPYQPIGVGFSYGSDSDDVTSTITAAPFVWKLLQAFYSRFPEYTNHNFGLFTESYGGHYGPEFAEYFEFKNDAIMQNEEEGIIIPLVALGINDPWFDAEVQYKSYIEYSLHNPYRSLINSSQAATLMDAYNEKCLPALNTCSRSHSNRDCSNAYNTCLFDVEIATANASSVSFDPYDVRGPYPDPFPSQKYLTYLQSENVMDAIGARVPFQNCSDTVFQKFNKTGDVVRSSLHALTKILRRGDIQVVVWEGDADWICNYFGVEELGRLQLNANETVHVNGVEYGMFKTAGKLSYLRVLYPDNATGIVDVHVDPSDFVYAIISYKQAEITRRGSVTDTYFTRMSQSSFLGECAETRCAKPRDIPLIIHNAGPLLSSYTYRSPAPTTPGPYILGVDEAGRGPVLGPLAYVVAYCPASYEEQLNDLGRFADSNTLFRHSRPAIRHFL